MKKTRRKRVKHKTTESTFSILLGEAAEYAKNSSKGTFITYVVLRMLVLGTLVIQMIHGNYYNVFLCVLTLVLFLIPAFVDKRLNIKLPSVLQIVILLFIFSAEILGEIQNFYGIFHSWDTMLHTINGFMMAAIGFALIDILNNDTHFHFTASPVFVAFVAFCFSMTVGVVWEFFEFGMDYIFLTDMQKDFIYNSISSVHTVVNPSGANTNVLIENVQTTITGTVNGEAVQFDFNGYLDIGIKDTMKDLLVNCLGAVVFSVLGIFYIKGRGRFAENFMPTLKDVPDDDFDNELINGEYTDEVENDEQSIEEINDTDHSKDERTEE